jgi:hypothetical protein
MTTCLHCGTPRGLRYYSLDRSIERITSVIGDSRRPGHESASMTYAVQILHAKELETFCHARCWQAVEAATIQAWAIRYPYPEQQGLMATCSRCGLAFLATHPHVTLNVMDMELDLGTGFASAEVHFAETLAQFCPECEPPGAVAAGAASAFDALPAQTPVADTVACAMYPQLLKVPS